MYIYGTLSGGFLHGLRKWHELFNIDLLTKPCNNTLEDTSGNCFPMWELRWFWCIVCRGPMGFDHLDVVFYFKGFLGGIRLRGPDYRNFVAVQLAIITCFCQIVFSVYFVHWIYAAHWISPFKFLIWGDKSTSYRSFLLRSIIVDPFGLKKLFVMVQTIEVSIERDIIS